MWFNPFSFTDLTSYAWFLGHHAPGTPAFLIFPKHSSSAPVSVVLDLQISTWLIATLPSYQFSSIIQSCPTLCNSMDCSTPGFPVHHQLLEFTQTHVHWVGDAMQPSYSLSSLSPPIFNPSWHQGLFQWVGSSHQVAKILAFQLYYQSFQWIFRTDFL